jgi:Tfp pilus assembly PilM family ATPase
MPDILAIHWDKRRLRVVEASIGSTVRVVQSFAVDVADPPKSGWLREALRRQGVTARQAVVCLPREDAILRQLELPDAPDDELPALVQFQASTRSTTPLDQLFLDYLPIPKRRGSQQRDVLLATVPRTTVDPVRAALAEAGLEMVSLSLSSFGLAELVLRAEDTHSQAKAQSRLIVLADSQRLEVVLLGQHQPMVAHMVRPPLDDDGRPVIAKAAADISRVLVPAQPWLTDSPIERIWVLGDSAEWDGLDQALRDRWNCPVERFDSQTAAGIRDLELTAFADSIVPFAPTLGLGLARLHPRSPVFDLLHPRQPRPKSDPRKLYLAVGTAAALLVVALFSSWYLLSMQSLDTRIAETREKERKLTADSNTGEPDRKAATLIEDWKTRDVNQLQQIAELYDFMQGTERVYVSEYNFGPSTGEPVAKLHATGNARERIDWQQLAQRLADARRYRVKPREVTQQSRDPDYPNRFELDTDLLPPGKPAADAAKPGTSAASGTPATPGSPATKDK